MLDSIYKFFNPLKKYKIKHGRIKELYQYKAKLVEEIKSLKNEKRNLTRKVNECKKDTEKISELKKSVKSLENDRLQLEIDIAKLYKTKELTLNIKDLENQYNKLKPKIETLQEEKAQVLQDVSDLKQEKALLIDSIDNLTVNKDDIAESSIFSIEYVDSLKDGLDFEKYFAKVLEKLGFYDIKVTDGSGDFGIDVLAYSNDILYGFQCKLYSNSVGNKAIQEAYSGKTHYDCNIAVVVTNNYFTNQAIQQAKDTKVLLWDRTILIKKLEEANKYNFTISY